MILSCSLSDNDKLISSKSFTILRRMKQYVINHKNTNYKINHLDVLVNFKKYFLTNWVNKYSR